MGRPYSLDLRQRVVQAVGSGMSRRAAAEHYDVSVSTAIRWTKRHEKQGSPKALPMGGKRPFSLAGELSWMTERMKQNQTSACGRCWRSCACVGSW